MKRDKIVSEFIKYFSNHMPDAKTELIYSNVFELTVAVILSAQCTDKRVNLITKKLFEKIPDVETMSKASFETIFGLIKSCSYQGNKSNYLSAMS